MKKHVSDGWRLGVKGHTNFEFVDVNILKDNELFIDPCLIDTLNTPWGRAASSTMHSFFDHFYAAYRQNNAHRIHELLSYAHEQNATHLGYSSGKYGTGNTPEGLATKFSALTNLSRDIETIRHPMDLPIFIPDFAEDGMSDMLTNVIRYELNQFTQAQCSKHNIKSLSNANFFAWDAVSAEWKEHNIPCLFADGSELMLVPKTIVRKRYFFNVGQYFQLVILDRIKRERGYTRNDGKTVYPSKKDIAASLPHEGEHWVYEYAVRYTSEEPSSLNSYHERINGLYYGRGMSDADLDASIY